MAGEPSAAESDSGVTDGEVGFKPYKSILNFSSSTRGEAAVEESSLDKTPIKPPAPWRRPVGAAHFVTSLEGSVDRLEDDPMYIEIMERTFAGFSDEVVGADVPVIDFRGEQDDATWGLDEHPDTTKIQGERPVLYAVADDVAAYRPSTGREK